MTKNITHIFLSKGVVALLNFIILLISARYLGASTRGEISVFLLNCLILQGVCEIYSGFIIVEYVSKYNFVKLVKQGVTLITITIATGTTLFYFANKLINGFEWQIALVFLLVIINSFCCNLLLGLKNIKTYNIVSFMQPLLLVFGMLFFIKISKNDTFSAYLTPSLFSFFFVLLVSIYVIFKSEKNYTKDYSFSEIIHKGYVVQFLLLILYLVNRYNFYFLNNTNELGVYSVSTTLCEAFLLISSSIAPVVITSQKSELNFENRTLTNKLIFISLCFVVIGYVFFYLIPESVFVNLFSRSFIGIKNNVLVYLPSVLFLSIIKILFYYFLITHSLLQILKWFVIAFSITLIVSPTLCNLYGYKGAAICSAIGYFIITVGLLISYKKSVSLT